MQREIKSSGHTWSCSEGNSTGQTKGWMPGARREKSGIVPTFWLQQLGFCGDIHGDREPKEEVSTMRSMLDTQKLGIVPEGTTKGEQSLKERFLFATP